MNWCFSQIRNILQKFKSNSDPVKCDMNLKEACEKSLKLSNDMICCLYSNKLIKALFTVHYILEVFFMIHFLFTFLTTRNQLKTATNKTTRNILPCKYYFHSRALLGYLIAQHFLHHFWPKNKTLNTVSWLTIQSH